MEITEAMGALMSALDDDPYCGKKKVKQSGKAVIDDIKGGVGSAETLRDNMIAAGIKPPKDPPRLAKGWNLFRCSKDTFPYQSHHLIPEKQLPTHPVTVWLTDSPKSKVKHDKYTLDADTKYDTNGALNGYFMPFASTTHQWESTSDSGKQAKICFEMMRRTKLQLHQGPHSKKDYLEEVDDVETEGYKTQVVEFLDLIDERAELHVEGCPKCKGEKKDGKIPVQPLDALVDQVNLASDLLEELLKAQRIFVSRRAATYFDNNRKGGAIIHPSKPFITEDD